MRRYKTGRVSAILLALCLVLGAAYPGHGVYAEDVSTNETVETASHTPIWEVDESADEEIVEQPLINVEAIDEESEDIPSEIPDDEVVRVFIVFEDDSVVDAGYSTEDIVNDDSALAYSDELVATQEEVIEKIEEEALDGETLEKNYSFTLLTNAVSADIKAGQVADIEDVDGVSAVYIVPQYEIQRTDDPMTMTSGEMVGSYSTWTSGYTGAGRRIAIIDTGIDIDHPSFSEEGFLYGLNETAEKNGKDIASYDLLGVDEIAASLEYLNAYYMAGGCTAEQLYYNNKVAFGFSYVDRDFDITHDNDDQGDHGTHVAGISAANKYIDGEGNKQELGVVGIAPDAQLLVMKVFGGNGGAYPDDYMAAIEDALVLGAHTINLSLGSSNAGESYADGEAYIDEIFNALQGTSSVVAISAGNEAYWSEMSQYGANLVWDVSVDTVGSPGSYKNAFTVASAINSSYTGCGALFNNEVSAYYDDGSSAYNKPFASLDTNGNGTEYDYVLLPCYGTPEDYEGIDVNGKIVLVSRGETSFYQKHEAAAAAGAKGVLIFNNTSGTISMSLEGSYATIPCASITLAEAQNIMASGNVDEEAGIVTGKVVVNSKVTINYNAPDAYLMSDFSSWGVPGDLKLKPEITAPGGNIYSTLDNGDYGVKSGTSMAAPSVSGISALVLQYIEENDLAAKEGISARTLAQSLIMSTANVLTQADGLTYSPRKQGAGLANALSATTSPAYILVGAKEGNDGKVKVELGDDPSRSGKYSFDFDVYNLSDDKVYFTYDSEFLTEAVMDDYYIANSSYQLSPSVKVSASSEQYLYDIDGNGKVNTNDAKALLKHINKSASYAIVDTFPDDYDFNKNGVLDTDDVSTLLSSIRWNKCKIDFKKKVFSVKDSTKVSVSVELSAADREYLDSNFENGMYIDGYVYLNGKVPMSVPVLAFYGNWSDSSMFEPFDSIEYFHGYEDQYTYSGISLTNFLTYQFAGDSSKYYYYSNFYADDDEYIPDRNAISSLSGDRFDALTYSLIRNAADVNVSITNADTGEVYYSYDKGSADCAFYYVSQRKWMNTSAKIPLNWAATDADGNALADGTRVNITLEALPPYYLDETKTPGKGVHMTFPVTVDNVAPTAALESFDSDAKTMTISLFDNRYVAAVEVFDKMTGENVGAYAVNQTEAGAATTLTIPYPESVFYLYVVDYAGNLTRYRVNMSGVDDTEIAESIELSDEAVTLLKGENYAIDAFVLPVTIIDDTVTWSSSDESVAVVNEDGIVTGVSEGEAVITATTNSLNADGEPLTAECYVSVIELSVDFDAIVWDENGEVNFSKFNSSDTSSITKLSDAMPVPFMSATLIGDLLLASDYTEDQGAASFYLVDPDTFDILGWTDAENFWATDMTIAYVNEYILASYGPYIVVYSTSLEMLGVLDMSEYTPGYITGITYAFSTIIGDAYADIFFAIDEYGNLLECIMYEDGRFVCAMLGETGISTNGLFYWQSLYYDEETDLVYYSCLPEGSDNVTLYAIAIGFDENDESYAVAMPLGDFPDSVWPVSGLYRWDDEELFDETLQNKYLRLETAEVERIDSIPSDFSLPEKKNKAFTKPVVEEVPVAPETVEAEIKEDEEETFEEPVETDADEETDSEEPVVEDVSENDTVVEGDAENED